MDRKFRFYDSSLVEAIKLEKPSVQEFFRLLALCHTVMPEERSEGKLFMINKDCLGNRLLVQVGKREPKAKPFVH